MNERKKELKEQYLQMKPDMGIFVIRSHNSKKCYLETSQNLKGMLNRVTFQLKMGAHKNRELQTDWKEHGENNFTIEILEHLKYDEDETKIDYSEELELLKMIWKEKLEKDNVLLYAN